MTTSTPERPRARTIRELGGEILGELFSMPPDQLRWDVRNVVVDVVMGVLARHAGTTLENDPDLPVAARPRSGDGPASSVPRTNWSDLPYEVEIIEPPGESGRPERHVDVLARFKTGDIFAATFFTLEDTRSLMQQYRTTGERAAGRYFWSRHMILVEDVARSTIERAIADL